MIFDVMIVGGGAAGLSAALVLGRMRRSVLVVDAGEPRNAPADGVHGFFTRDGTPPAELLRMGREQLAPYTSVTCEAGQVRQAQATEDGFTLTLADERQYHGRKLLLATGVTDLLPPIDGIEQFWGRGVYHCPYCHGWEVRDQPLAVIGSDFKAVHQALLLTSLTRDLVVCTNGPAALTADEQATLTGRGIQICETEIEALVGEPGALTGLRLADGTTLARRGVFLAPGQRLKGDLAQQLGCALTETGQLQVDDQGQTTVAGVYAAGDLMTIQQVIQAAAAGAKVGALMNMQLALQ